MRYPAESEPEDVKTYEFITLDFSATPWKTRLTVAIDALLGRELEITKTSHD